MKNTDYGLRPTLPAEIAAFPKRVHAEFWKMDDAEQSYFRANPGDIVKHPKIAHALFVDRVVARVLTARMLGESWVGVKAHLKDDFGLEVSESTLRRWCAQA